MKQNELLLLVVSCFVLVLIWIGFNLYHAHANSTGTETETIQVVPITPEFDKSVIEALKSRVPVEPLFESSKPPAASSTPVLSPTRSGTSSAVNTTITPSRR